MTLSVYHERHAGSMSAMQAATDVAAGHKESGRRNPILRVLTCNKTLWVRETYSGKLAFNVPQLPQLFIVCILSLYLRIICHVNSHARI